MNIYILSNRDIVNQNDLAGINGENNAEIMYFHFPEQIVGIDMSTITKWIQFKNEELDLLQMLENDQYSLTDLITQYESVNYQVLLKYEETVLWKSKISELNFDESLDISTTITIDDLSVLNQLKLQYEELLKQGNTDIDNLIKKIENLEKEINQTEGLRVKSEESRIIAENKRVQAEKERNQVLTDLVKEVNDTILRLAHSVEEYNQNAETQLGILESKANGGVSDINSAQNSALASISNAESTALENIGNEKNNIIEAIGNEVDQRVTEFDSHVEEKTNTFDTNATNKTDDFNDNYNNKLDSFNTNVQEKIDELNSEETIDRISKLETENSYQNKIIDGVINSNDTEIVEGDNITIDDCLNVPIKDFKIYGNESKQEILHINSNLFDENNTTKGIAINSNGIEITLSTFRISEFIRVKYLITYVLSFIAQSGESQTIRVHFYDENKNWLSQVSIVSSKQTERVSFNFEPPQNCKYIRVSIYNGFLDVMVSEGSKNIQFVEHQSEIINLTNLPNAENYYIYYDKILYKYFIHNIEILTDTEITDTVLIEQLDKLRTMFLYKGTNHFIVTAENGQPANLKIEVYKDSIKIMKEQIKEILSNANSTTKVVQEDEEEFIL